MKLFLKIWEDAMREPIIPGSPRKITYTRYREERAILDPTMIMPTASVRGSSKSTPTTVARCFERRVESEVADEEKSVKFRTSPNIT